MSAEDIDQREREAFLLWRREIASMEDTESNIRATPFEKNIEVWRQLWRVLEKSDITVQIVDARNPLLYYSKDLMTYASEHSPPRPMLILVNKADFLTPRQRLVWAQYLTDIGIKFAFYSAQIEQLKIDGNALKPKRQSKIRQPKLDGGDSDAESSQDEDESSGDEAESEDDSTNFDAVNAIIRDLVEQYQTQNSDNSVSVKTSEPDVESEYVWGDETTQVEQVTSSIQTKSKKSQKSSIQRQSRVLTRLELIYFLTNLPHALGIVPQSRHRGHICVGLVGFPNVGKSSVINTILGVSKSTHGVVRVGVSSTPGKTKHFQTLDINDELMLCDCPGLVFPSFMRSRGDMVCAGILPINQMRDYFEPANIMASRIPQHLLEAAYGIHIRRELDIKDNPNRPPTGSEFLSAYCAVKGFITAGTGRWDEFRACKEVLRDYNDGRILYVAPPPPMISGTTNSSGVSMDEWLRDTELTMSRREIVANRLAQQKLIESDEQEKKESLQTNVPNLTENFSDMVFGDGNVAYELNPSDENYVYTEDGDDIEEGDDTSENPAKREHKRLKHWGKKNRKLRDKNPYDDDKGVYIVHTTNRTGIVRGGEVSSKPTRTRRQDPHYSRSHETAFIRSQPIPPSTTS